MSTYPHYLQRLQDATRKFWDKPALNNIGGETFNYAQMATQIEKFHLVFEKLGFKKGEKIARTMIDYARTIDDSRLYTYGCSGGFGVVKQVDIHGYNYIVQNDVNNRHKAYPDWVVVGTEETSGCGTRNVYKTDSLKGWMKSKI